MFQELQKKAQATRNVSPTSTQIQHQCPKCKDLGGTMSYEEYAFGIEKDRSLKYEVWKECECQKNKRIERMFKSSQITEEFRKLGFKNFSVDGMPNVVREAFDISATYFRNFEEIEKERKNSIALLGRPGSGKTHLLMAISNNLIKKGIPVIYFPWVEGFNELKNDFDLLDTKIRRLQTVRVLFLDDLFKGREKPTDFQIEQLFAIVNYRYLNKLPILVSSERTFKDMCVIDEATGSRLYQMTADYRATLEGEGLNYRTRDAEVLTNV
ncbi:ATP-binding protein [Brevibacillus laterosporus]|uniref:ATP-binding protein n=1 Tax=Brevibacillus laterosporus TaxID=1465 RepID=A0A518V4X6_BRELA|nr:ATP-binding protein [Brevibacillus laterosporus]